MKIGCCHFERVLTLRVSKLCLKVVKSRLHPGVPGFMMGSGLYLAKKRGNRITYCLFWNHSKLSDIFINKVVFYICKLIRLADTGSVMV